MNKKQILRVVRDNNIKLVRFVYCDVSGIIRGKVVPGDRLEQRLSDGIGLTVAQQAVNMLDQLQQVEGFDPVGEIRLIPDLDTFNILPYAPGTAEMLCSLVTLDKKNWEACTRNFLNRMIRKAEDCGLIIQAAFENEFCLFRKNEKNEYIPIDENNCFSTISMTPAAAVINDVIDSLGKQGIEVDLYYPECAFGQHEIPIRYSEALSSADNQILFRDTVRSVAWNHGLFASFAPKPDLKQAGNGSHIHFSLWDLKKKKNLTYSSRDPYKTSGTARHFIAGILKHTKGLLALTASNVNSYRRLKPFSWCSAFTCWGPDNRESTVRVVSGLWKNEALSTNLEYRPCDPGNNPYLALGGLIAAGIDGIEKKLVPGAPVSTNPGRMSLEERTEKGIEAYPGNLEDALVSLEEDAVLMDALGSRLAKVFLAVKHSEYEAFKNESVEFELKNHIYRY